MGQVLVFLYDTMADFEMTLAAQFVACVAHHTIVPISYGGAPCKGTSGLVYQAAMSVQQALELDDVDGLIIPGGMSGDFRPELNALIKRLDDEDKLLAAISAGPYFLARAGVLNGRRFTTALTEWSDANRLRYGGDDPFPRETCTSATMERDGHVITAIGHAFVEFALSVAAAVLALHRGRKV